MLILTQTIKGAPLIAANGAVGHVTDFLIEDHRHCLRWIVIETGPWLSRKKILVPPTACQVDDSTHSLTTTLTIEQIEAGPDFTSDETVGRAYENLLFEHYCIAPYWDLSSGLGMLPPSVERSASDDERIKAIESRHLRSAQEIIGYTIHAQDGSIGHIADLVFSAEAAWPLRYVIVNTNNWLPGGDDVVLAPQWLGHFDYLASEVSTPLSKETIRTSPKFDKNYMCKDYEKQLHAHYAVHESELEAQVLR